METPHGPTMPRIGRACLMLARPCPAVTGAACAKTFSPAELLLRDSNHEAPRRTWRNPEASLPHPLQRNEWAIDRLRLAYAAGTGALLAAFGMAERRGCRATTDIQASERRGPEAIPRVAEVAATTVAAADRSEGKPWQE